MQLFEIVSGLKVNFHKSLLVGINTQLTWLEEAAEVLNCKVGALPFKYLGLPVGGDHRREGLWKPVVDAVRNRLSKWNNRHLSIGGRIVLLKSVLYALPVYFLSFFKAPSGIISKLESLFKRFLWGGGVESRKINWVNWDKICREKEDGGWELII
jgi:hypothetical protein